MQQQMKQREDKKAAREQQMHFARMECKASEQVHKEREMQRERRYQDFMMMIMMMVTDTKSPLLSISSPSLLSSLSVSPVTLSKGDESKKKKIMMM
eukprot:7516670-Ditylum_brightwellii.AAC.1